MACKKREHDHNCLSTQGAGVALKPFSSSAGKCGVGVQGILGGFPKLSDSYHFLVTSDEEEDRPRAGAWGSSAEFPMSALPGYSPRRSHNSNPGVAVRVFCRGE